MPDDLNFQKLSSVQNSLQPGLRDIVSAATIAPTTFLSRVSGTVQLVTITPPVTGDHMLVLIFSGAMGVFSTAGNLLIATAPVVNVPVLLFYDSKQAKYYSGRSIT